MSVRHYIAAVVAAFAFPGGVWCAPATAKSADVTFVAWNVRNYTTTPVADSSGRIITPAKQAESAQAVAGTLAHLKPDIVGLSEIGSRKDLEDLQQRLDKLGVELPHSAWVEGADRERHLALLSRFPLGDAHHDTKSGFTLGGFPHRVQRGFLDCTATVLPGFDLRIIGAHFKSRRIVPEFDQAEFRRNESLLLRAKVDGILRQGADTRLLVFGDLNDHKNSPAVAGLAGKRGSPAGLEILELADKVGDQWTYHWSESDEYSRVDYVMASKALLPLVRKGNSMVFRAHRWEEASDHRPLVVKIGPLPAGKQP